MFQKSTELEGVDQSLTEGLLLQIACKAWLTVVCQVADQVIARGRFGGNEVLLRCGFVASSISIALGSVASSAR